MSEGLICPEDLRLERDNGYPLVLKGESLIAVNLQLQACQKLLTCLR